METLEISNFICKNIKCYYCDSKGYDLICNTGKWIREKYCGQCKTNILQLNEKIIYLKNMGFIVTISPNMMYNMGSILTILPNTIRIQNKYIINKFYKGTVKYQVIEINYNSINIICSIIKEYKSKSGSLYNLEKRAKLSFSLMIDYLNIIKQSQITNYLLNDIMLIIYKYLIELIIYN